jgi:hypothetical protein
LSFQAPFKAKKKEFTKWHSFNTGKEKITRDKRKGRNNDIEMEKMREGGESQEIPLVSHTQ